MERMRYQSVNRMKFIAIIFAITLSACVGTKHTAVGNVKAKVPKYRKFETFNNDTVAYLMYNIKERKDRYIGKPIKSVLKDLEINPIRFSPQNYIADIKKCYEGIIILRKNKKFTYIYIDWKPELSYDTIEAINKKYNRHWSEELEKYIGNRIITNIGVNGDM